MIDSDDAVERFIDRATKWFFEDEVPRLVEAFVEAKECHFREGLPELVSAFEAELEHQFRDFELPEMIAEFRANGRAD